MKATLKGLRGLKGLTSLADSNGDGYKGRWEHLFALRDILIKLMEPTYSDITLSAYDARGQYMRSVSYSRDDLYDYISENFLDDGDLFIDFLPWVESELEKE